MRGWLRIKYEEAFEMGKEKGKEAGKEIANMSEPCGPIGDLVSLVSDSLYGYRQSAEYCNHVLPELREMAGYKDMFGAGTYTHVPDEESYHLNQELMDRWEQGYSAGFKDGYHKCIKNKSHGGEKE